MAMQQTITEDMSSEEIAKIIFEKFSIMESCKIEGFEQNLKGQWKAKGELVCDLLWEYDRASNVRVRGDKKSNRIQRKPPNSIGGYLADKIFRWKYIITEDSVKYTLWRIQ